MTPGGNLANITSGSLLSPGQMEESPKGRVLVLGLGNLLMRDEGVGIHAIEELANRRLPAHVDLMDGGTPGTDLLGLLEGYAGVLIVDAVDAGQEPGSILRLTWDQAISGSAGLALSLHQADVLGVLRLASYVGRPLPPIVIYGIQPSELCWSTDLSPVVRSRLQSLLDAVEEELSSL